MTIIELIFCLTAIIFSLLAVLVIHMIDNPVKEF